MKSGYNWFKWIVIAGGIIAVMYMFRECNCGNRGGSGRLENDTISIKHDTFYKDTGTTIVKEVPVPYKEEVPKYIPVYEEGPIKYLPLDSFPPVVTKMLIDYSTTRYYHDSMDVQYGKLHVLDTLRNNKFIGKRSILLQQSIPEITKTITLREEKRTVGYIGFTVMGNKYTPIKLTQGSFGFKFKSDKYLGISAALIKDDEAVFGVETKLPIRFRKR